jgi:hypothetical protein
VYQPVILHAVIGIRSRHRKPIVTNIPEQVCDQVGHRQSHINIHTIGLVLDMDDTNVQIEIEVRE